MMRSTNFLVLSLSLTSMLWGCRGGTSEGDDEVGETASDTATDSTSSSESGSSSSDSGTDSTDSSDSSDTTDTTDTTDSTDTTDTGGLDEGLACGAVQACIDGCLGGDLPCQQDCQAQASMHGADEYALLLQCIVDNACQDDACVTEQCGAEAFACFTGSSTCAEVAACADACAGDSSCQLSCYFEASPLAQDQANGLQDCIGDNACVDDACIVENCTDPLQTCVGGMSDVLPCPALAGCVLDCAGDSVCVASCESVASPSAQNEAPPLLDCAAQQGCTDFDCTQMACPTEWATCVSGSLDCVDLVGCVEACAGAGLCQLTCFTEASFMGQALFGALDECIAANQCADEACIAANCGNALMACGL